MARTLCLGLLLVSATLLAGCSKEEEKKQVAAPPPPPPPPPAPRCPLDQLRTELQISDKVVISEAEAPPNCDDRRNILVFFDAFVNGHSDTLREMMDPEDSIQLEAMINANHLESSSTRIREVSLQTGTSPEGRSCVLALYLLDDGYVAQLWYYKDVFGASNFEAAPQPPDVVERLSGTDLIESWFTVLQKERELYEEYDEQVDDLTPQAETSNTGSGWGSGGSRTGGGGVPTGPIGPGGPGGPNPNGPVGPGGPGGPG